MPMSVICHCNNCRSATGQIPSMGLITDIKTVRASVLPRDEGTPAEGPLSAEQRQFAPAAEVFGPENLSALKTTFLAQYKSSPARNRWFCGRCGTQLAYSIDAGVIPEEWGWPKMLDIWLGTVDRYVYMKWRRIIVADGNGKGMGVAEADVPLWIPDLISRRTSCDPRGLCGAQKRCLGSPRWLEMGMVESPSILSPRSTRS